MTVSLSRLQSFYGERDAHSLLRAMIREEFAGEIAVISSFGADTPLTLSLVAEVDPATPVLFLETGKHFPETLEFVEDVTRHFKLTSVYHLKPDPALLQNVDPKGELWQSQPNRCCWLRKVEPLDRAVKEMGLKALITGRKRYQTPERGDMSNIEQDDKGVFRINPLAHWTREDVKRETGKRKLPRHPLLDQGYLSIGCQPCTRPVQEGEDERAGRWAHTIGLEEEKGNQKTECGIHVPGADNWSV